MSHEYLTAEEVGRPVRVDERTIKDMYSAGLLEAATCRQGQPVFSQEETDRWREWYSQDPRKNRNAASAVTKILFGIFTASASVALILSATGVWKQATPVLLILCLTLPAIFVAPIPRPGLRFEQVEVAVAGVAVGLTIADPLLSLFGIEGSGSNGIGLFMLLCSIVGFVFGYPEMRTWEGRAVIAPGKYLFVMAGSGAIVLVAAGPRLGADLGLFPLSIIGALLFGAAALTQLMRRTNSHAFTIVVPAAAFFGWEPAFIALLLTCGLMVVGHLIRLYLDSQDTVTTSDSTVHQ